MYVGEGMCGGRRAAHHLPRTRGSRRGAQGHLGVPARGGHDHKRQVKVRPLGMDARGRAGVLY